MTGWTFLFFQMFELYNAEPPDYKDLIQTVRCFFLLPKSSALRKVIVNCQAQIDDEHQLDLVSYFKQFLRQAVEDSESAPQVPLPGYVLSCLDCGDQDHPAKEAVKAEATLLAPAVMVWNLIPSSKSC